MEWREWVALAMPIVLVLIFAYLTFDTIRRANN